MNYRQLEAARSIVRAHYQLERRVTDEEVHAEIANVARKRDRGIMDDRAALLDAALYSAMLRESR